MHSISTCGDMPKSTHVLRVLHVSVLLHFCCGMTIQCLLQAIVHDVYAKLDDNDDSIEALHWSKE